MKAVVNLKLEFLLNFNICQQTTRIIIAGFSLNLRISQIDKPAFLYYNWILDSAKLYQRF